MKQVPLTKGHFASVDDEDFQAVSALRWVFCGGYACHWYTDASGKRRRLWLHRFVAEKMFGKIPKNMQIDHISGGRLGIVARLDNTRGNLRLADRSSQQSNKGVQINCSSGCKGITLRAGRYEVRLRHYGQRLYLGRYDSLETAWKVYGLAHRICWRSFSTEDHVPDPSPELQAYVLGRLLEQGVDVNLTSLHQ